MQPLLLLAAQFDVFLLPAVVMLLPLHSTAAIAIAKPWTSRQLDCVYIFSRGIVSSTRRCSSTSDLEAIFSEQTLYVLLLMQLLLPYMVAEGPR